MPTRQVSERTPTEFVLPTGVPGAHTAVEPDNAGSDDQIAEITGRLERRYPSERISRSDLEARVRSAYRQFDTARIAPSPHCLSSVSFGTRSSSR